MVADVYKKTMLWQKLHNTVVKFDTYQNLQQHRMVLPDFLIVEFSGF